MHHRHRVGPGQVRLLRADVVGGLTGLQRGCIRGREHRIEPDCVEIADDDLVALSTECALDHAGDGVRETLLVVMCDDDEVFHAALRIQRRIDASPCRDGPFQCGQLVLRSAEHLRVD
jgi:hypothetical protein